MSVVLPDDSGPKISTMRPRGKPPTPSAMSSDRAPEGIAETFTAAASSPIFMIDPCPNWRSIWVSALFSAESRAFAAFSVSVSIWVLLAFFEMDRRVRARSDTTPDQNANPSQGLCDNCVTADRSGDEQAFCPRCRLLHRPGRVARDEGQRSPAATRGQGGPRSEGRCHGRPPAQDLRLRPHPRHPAR